RLTRLAGRILHESFPRLEHLHSTHTVLHEGLIRLVTALRDHQPGTRAEFFGFAALQMRRWLRDQTRRPRGRGRAVLSPDVSGEDQGPRSPQADPPLPTPPP